MEEVREKATRHSISQNYRFVMISNKWSENLYLD